MKKKDVESGRILPMHAGDRDTVFASESSGDSDFRFDSRTAAAFDDMVSRSVPFYDEMQRMAVEIAADFALPGTNLFDLGCSTGTTLLSLDPVLDQGVRFVGIDNSNEMLDKARAKLEAAKLSRPYELRLGDLNRESMVENASVVIMILTLQFVRPLHRRRVIEQVFSGLGEQGCLIIVEKQTMQDSLLNRLFIRYYYDMKRRNGYSEVEIAKKREALENVLIPYRPDENRELLRSVGFECVEEFFRWYNFAALVAVKQA